MTADLREVAREEGGVYLPRPLARFLAGLITAGIMGIFANLWQLNTKSILFENHLSQVQTGDIVLPGTLSRREWDLEKESLASNLNSIDRRLLAIEKYLKESSRNVE